MTQIHLLSLLVRKIPSPEAKEVLNDPEHHKK